MRIERLTLLKYGKFSGHTVELPPSGHDKAAPDLHVIVGRNEAGKSTLRAAVSDLLYGFPKSPPQTFVHPMNELRLGAVIEQGGERLEFQRSKGLKNTVRSMTDVPLPDAVLAPFLGPTDRSFFEQMFGLDHDRLVAGGHDILSAGNDIGKILFAAASGIEGVSRVREALEAEAEALWAPRKSRDREYFAAQDEFEAATAALKAATLRSKEWSEAHDAVNRLDDAIAQARAAHAALQTRRNALERVRRVAPYLSTLRDRRQALLELGPTPELPATAAQTLFDTEREMAQVQAVLQSQQALRAEAVAARAAIELDDAVLARAADIRSLDELRLQLRTHEADIVRREAEVDARWRTACGAAVQLGWEHLGESALRERLPPLPRRKSLERLVGQHAAQATALQAATRAEVDKSGEWQRVQSQLQALAVTAVSPGLRAAVTAAQQLGDTQTLTRQRESERARRETGLRAAQAALAAGPARDITALRAITVPSADTLESFQQAHAQDAADARANAARIEALRSEHLARQLDVAQYRETHHPVTRADVLARRQVRDALWSGIKQGERPLAEAAAGYERLVGEADTAADEREATAQQAAHLQARTHEVDRLALELASRESERERLLQAGAGRAARWAALVQGCGLAGMAQDALAPWLEARKAALAAADALDEAQRAGSEWAETVRSRTDALVAELQALELPVADGAPLAALLLQALGVITSADVAQAQRNTLQSRADDATQALVALRRDRAGAQAQMDQWQAAWAQATAQMGITHGDTALGLGEAEGALTLMAVIDGALAEMHKLRSERIDTMRADLARLAATAAAVAGAVAPELAGHAAADVAITLAQRAARAQAAQTEAARREAEAHLAGTRARDAQTRIDALRAGLRPLLERAGAESLADLSAAIARTDAARQLQSVIAAAEQGLRDGGDGLSAVQLHTEADAVPLGEVSAQVQELAQQMEVLREQQNALSAEHATACVTLAKMAGSADAARCESRRQEALARMADAVERYVKVSTAAQLLKWAIERFRETRQGPMLARAGAIFAALTLNSFDALTVDFDSQALKLQGRRPGGARVDVAGMSEGTRDQLYLALRLAALDLHLGQAHALPFIADDLFINYDDARSRAGLVALGELARKTQVIFLTHHEHLLPLVHEVFGPAVNVVALEGFEMRHKP